MNVNFELGEKVEGELELLEDVDELLFRWRFGSNGKHSVAEIFLLRFPTSTTFLLQKRSDRFYNGI